MYVHQQKPLANRLALALLRVQRKAKLGELPEEARWINRTRLIFLKRKQALFLAPFAMESSSEARRPKKFNVEGPETQKDLP